jgi:hypothetical protein
MSVKLQFNIASVGWDDIGVLYLSYEDSVYQVELQKDNQVTLPILDRYPPYFNILDQNLDPMFATIFIEKDSSFTKPRLYTSRSETFIVLVPSGF